MLLGNEQIRSSLEAQHASNYVDTDGLFDELRNCDYSHAASGITRERFTTCFLPFIRVCVEQVEGLEVREEGEGGGLGGRRGGRGGGSGGEGRGRGQGIGRRGRGGESGGEGRGRGGGEEGVGVREEGGGGGGGRGGEGRGRGGEEG